MKKHAIVDLGSNTIRLSVYEEKPDGSYHLLFSEKETAGLAGYIEKGMLTEPGIARACEALDNFHHLLRIFGMEEMRVFATASLRNIKNTWEATQAIQARTGLSIDVISGEQEARLSYYGALSQARLEHGMLFDIGGGSTELVAFAAGRIQMAQSFSIGSLNLFQNHVSEIWPKKSEIKDIVQEIREVLKPVKEKGWSAAHLCGVGGTARAALKIANVYHRLPKDNRMLVCSQVSEVCQALERGDKKARDLVLRVCPERVHTIIPGMLLLDTLGEILCCEDIYISPYGVREGYLCHVLG